MHRWIDHTSEVELEIRSPAEAGVFCDALLAFRELLHAAGDVPADERREVDLENGDRAGLLADFIEELVYLAETQGFVPAHADRVHLEGPRLRATVIGHAGDPPHVVKAVTYHRLAFERDGDAYRARVVLDV